MSAGLRRRSAAAGKGQRGGWSIAIAFKDPVTGRTYDLLNAKDQQAIRRLVKRDRPHTIVLSPPCTAFSIANQSVIDISTWNKAVEMIRFAVELCEMQRKSWRHFVFEQPRSARSWNPPLVQEVLMREGVHVAEFHQCEYGLEATDDLGRQRGSTRRRRP